MTNQTNDSVTVFALTSDSKYTKERLFALKEDAEAIYKEQQARYRGLKFSIVEKQLTSKERSKLVTKKELSRVVDALYALYGGIVAPSELVKKPRGFGKKSNVQLFREYIEKAEADGGAENVTLSVVFARRLLNDIAKR